MNFLSCGRCKKHAGCETDSEWSTRQLVFFVKKKGHVLEKNRPMALHLTVASDKLVVRDKKKERNNTNGPTRRMSHNLNSYLLISLTWIPIPQLIPLLHYVLLPLLFLLALPILFIIPVPALCHLFLSSFLRARLKC